MDEATSPPPLALERLPYHRQICEFLRRTDADVWQWFASHKVRDQQVEQARFELLKQAYRIDRADQPALYASLDEAARRLDLAAPATLYQSQHPQGLNASLAYIPGEVHIVLHGPIAAQLNERELVALFAHELCHHLLLSRFEGELLIAEDMLLALVNDRHAHAAHAASYRLLRLYNEIFCDRGSLLACGDLHTVVGMLVKIETGSAQVSAESYLRQAEEIFARGPQRAGEVTHPESFIRARAVRLWSEDDPQADDLVRQMIEGPLDMASLDLLAQERASALTRQIIDALLSPAWMQTDALLAHARLFFDGYEPPPQGPALGAALVETDSLRDYLAYLLLDFASADRELDEAPLALALTIAEQLGIKARFCELARQELRLRKGQVDKIDQSRQSIIDEAAAAEVEAP